MDAKFYVEIAIIAIVILVAVLWLAWQIKKKGLKEVAVGFIIKAEDMYKKGENQEKLNYVIDKVITFIPIPFNLFVTRDMVKSLVQTVFDEIKKALDYVPKKED